MSENSRLSCSEETQINMANALKMLMQAKPFSKISVTDITNACNIHRQTFYYHFSDKYELLEWIVFHELIEPVINEFSLDNMYQRIEELFSIMADQPKFYQSALRISVDDLSRYIGNVAVEKISAVLTAIEKDNGIDSDKSSHETMCELLGYGICGIIITWAQHGMKDSPKAMTEKIKTIVDSCKKVAVYRALSSSYDK